MEPDAQAIAMHIQPKPVFSLFISTPPANGDQYRPISVCFV
jgi:hypothetical protein